MGKRSKGEGEVIYVLSVSKEGENEVTTAHVMREVAEELLAKAIVTEILDKATAIRI